ncbi:monovalent cation/H(+) antiporter subunit G [Haloechinothrix halophila]|uniref:monovalent cation/H(+) antiporter subunit G n=1 Tax=Haloechinothrix halophila TaxID=1069073 RepID=UPI00041597BA|nr:monovalent cation/H(+) antiporter subunit G [Haloechinothrix halophila]
MIDVVSAVLLVAGGLIGLAGAIGLVRFPDVMSRVQAATKPQTLGLLLILVAAALRLDPKTAAGLALVALFQVITAPVLAQLIGRTAYRTGHVVGLSRDDLARDNADRDEARDERDHDQPEA